MKPDAKVALSALTNLIISQDPPQGYEAEDLTNACWIFTTILGELLTRNNPDLSFEQKALLAEEVGRNLHQTVLLSTKIDLKVKDKWPEVIRD